MRASLLQRRPGHSKGASQIKRKKDGNRKKKRCTEMSASLLQRRPGHSKGAKIPNKKEKKTETEEKNKGAPK